MVFRGTRSAQGIEGMKIVEDIEKVKTGPTDRPLHDIRIIKAKVEE